MNLTIFGATGGLGQAVLQQALDRGHVVRAHARSAESLADSPGLTRIAGNIGDADSVGRALDGADGVISAMGFARGQDPAVFGYGMRHILDGMSARGQRRLVAISGAGLELDGDATPLSRRLIITALKLLSPRLLAGKEHEWAAISDSELDWTLVRVARMVDKPGKGEVAVDARQVTGSPVVAYPDVARWMLDQLQEPAWIRSAPFVSGG